MLNAAIVGLGRWGQNLVDSVAGKSDRIRFTRAVARTPAKVAAYCQEKGIALSADYAEALADRSVGAIVLATPHTQHSEQILAAAKAGKHVFVEKPFTLSESSARAALDACKAAGLAVGIGMNRRFYPALAEMKRMIEAGELGTILHAEANVSANLAAAANTWRANRTESPGGGMTSLGIHGFDALVMLLGPIRIIDCRSARRVMPFDVDDVTAMLMTFESGVSAYLACIAATAHVFSLRVFGSKGWAHMPNYDTLVKATAAGWGPAGIETKNFPSTPTIKLELEAFADAAEGRAPFPIPPAEILHVVAAFDAMLSSAKRGSPCSVG
jgi:predicted dehydrogenase